jgi:hypothetical protein
MLARCARAVAEVVTVIKTLITAAHVVGFDETTLRCGPAGAKKYVLSASTDNATVYHLGGRDLDSLAKAGILPQFAGVAVHDRYGNYFHRRWANLAGHQACNSHYPDTVVMPTPGGPVLAGGGDRVRDLGIITGLRGRPAADQAAGSGRAGLLAGWSGRGLAA